jgi:flagellar basal-body rod modification protein FlgD
MAVEGITANEAAANVSTSRSKIAKDLDSFMLLLTAQLKNQDPLSPMDSTEFTNQLVQFAQVEQQITQNESLASLLGLTQMSIVSNSVNYIGKTIEGDSKDVPLQGGKLRAAYGIGQDADKTTIVVRDAGGQIVHTQSGEKTAGVHEFIWDGKDSTGKQLSDGPYTVEAQAVSADGATLETWTTAFGKVTGITTINGQTVVLLDKVAIPLDMILSISETAGASPDPDPEADPEADPQPEPETTA